MKNLVYSLIMLGELREALAESTEGLRQYPAFTDLVFLQGVVGRSLGQFPEAIGLFHQCLAMGRAPTPPHVGVDPSMAGWKAEHALGYTHELRGEWEKAAAFYRRAWRGGQNAETLSRFARLLVVHRRLDAAEVELTALLRPATPDRHWRGALRHLELAGSGEPQPERFPLHPACIQPDLTAVREQRMRSVEALCRYHLGDFAGARDRFASLPESFGQTERLVVRAASAPVKPAALVAQLGTTGVRQVLGGLLDGAISALEQGLQRLPDCTELQTALARAVEEAKRLG